MHLVVGTYERFLLGYAVPDALEAGGAQLARAFTHASHQGPVRCVDAAGAYVVSGGSDDQLHLYDVKRGRDLGFLMNPGEGAVPCLQLYTPPGAASPSHLFSGSADGGIAIWRAGGEWEHLKMMKGHRGAVNALAVHPSGRLALSVAHDRQLRMWDLLRGRCTYTAGLDAEGVDIQLGPRGDTYALLCGRTLTLHAAGGEGGLLARLDSEDVKFTCLGRGRQDERVLLVGQEDGTLALWDTREGGGPGAAASARLASRVEKAHKTRIRAIEPVTPDDGGPLPRHVATASSDGVIKIWDCRRMTTVTHSAGCSELANADTKGRITCMTLSAPGRRQAALAGGAGGDAEATDAGEQKTEPKEQRHRQPLEKRQQQQQDQQRQQQQQKRKHQVAASGEQQPAKAQQPVKQGQQQQQQQQQKMQKQQQQKQQKRQKQVEQFFDDDDDDVELEQQQQQRGKGGKAGKQHKAPLNGAGSRRGDGEALVPRVQTVIKKKKKREGHTGQQQRGQQQRRREGQARGSGASGSGGISITNRKAPRPGRS